MKNSRRRFLKIFATGVGATVGTATLWLSTSERRAARWARRIVHDLRRPILSAPVQPQPATWRDNAITAAWLGHSTVLINFYGFRVLTDPALASTVGVSLGLWTAGPKRYIAPALKLKQLPPIDVVLLSHAHMDHMDLPSLRRLRNSTFITAKNTSDILAPVNRTRITELAWGDSASVDCPAGQLHVEAFQVKHWGQRWPSEKPRGYNGYILEREGKRLLFAGDTALTSDFGELRSRGPFEFAIMPIGAYRPWIWNHCSPEEAWDMARRANARRILPVHHQTFRLSEEPMNEPIERLQAALAAEPDRLGFSRVGETFVCPATA